ncbi:hypothetical protein Pla110_41270 [Polystyrenella longa]|uniref:EF hand n=1 Tax=Polystyrenella longa TaxID=2528007 RepID=A0A518CT21_9PLAN|nr:DUF1549 domain-containing protein [Polystyrenella longa]QDU82372.1 hypothetical protein Pla110_41270 [Polystyrenella longa]
MINRADLLHHPLPMTFVMVVGLVLFGFAATSASAADSTKNDPRGIAHQIDQLIQTELDATGAIAAPLTNDEDFLRRVYFDVTGTAPSSTDIIRFGLSSDSTKRAKVIDELLAKKAYSENWARYWRDVIYSKATETRSLRQRPIFANWMAEQLQQNRSWDEIATELLTATGRMSEDGSTGLIFAHNADGETVAAEASRIFLGIQIQCAQCHDHFTDQWTRVQFHELASFFPRTKVRVLKDEQPRDFEVYSVEGKQSGAQQQLIADLQDPEQFFKEKDTDEDELLSTRELGLRKNGGLFRRVLKTLDANEDKQLSLEELKKFTVPAQFKRNQAEHFMSDLDDPAAQGTRMSPAFFLNETPVAEGLTDLDRRGQVAEFITSPDNEWFARAYINRIWNVLLGEGFYPTIDDIGPERDLHHPEVVDLLSQEFVASGYDVKWLFQVILNTGAYQRQSMEMDPSQETSQFASVVPTRLRADQLYDAIACALDTQSVSSPAREVKANGKNKNKKKKENQNKKNKKQGDASRNQFQTLFEYDPSEDSAEISGTIPQALFLMNSPTINNQIENRRSFVQSLLKQKLSQSDSISEIYLQILGREPDAGELELIAVYIQDSPNPEEAYEDLVWSLINSAEFLTKR